MRTTSLKSNKLSESKILIASSDNNMVVNNEFSSFTNMDKIYFWKIYLPHNNFKNVIASYNIVYDKIRKRSIKYERLKSNRTKSQKLKYM